MRVTAIFHDPDGETPETVAYGIPFRDGQPVDISQQSGFVVGKLRGNRFFEVRSDGIAPVKQEIVMVINNDHPDELASVVADLEALGIKVDKRKKLETLRAELEKAITDG